MSQSSCHGTWLQGHSVCKWDCAGVSMQYFDFDVRVLINPTKATEVEITHDKRAPCHYQIRRTKQKKQNYAIYHIKISFLSASTIYS